MKIRNRKRHGNLFNEIPSPGNDRPVVVKGEIELTYDDTRSTIVLTPLRGWSSEERILSNKEIDSGVDNSIVRQKISGRILGGKKYNIAKLEITANDNECFSSIPYLDTDYGDIIKLNLISAGRTNGRTTSYVFNISYKNNASTTIADALIANFKYTILTELKQNVRPPTISSISFGNKYINSNGETREIVVRGDHGATFALAVNENYKDDITYTATGASEVIPEYNKVRDVSILSNSNANSTATHDYGSDMPIVERTIGKKGFYSFKQKFPNNRALNCTVDGATSSSQYSNFDDVTGVRVGDRVYSDDISTALVVKVEEVVSGIRLKFDTSLSLSDNSTVSFKRTRCYSIDIIPELTSTLANNISTANPSYRLHQYINPIIKLNHTITGTPLKVLTNKNLATGLGFGDAFVLSYSGEAGSRPSILDSKKRVTFTVQMNPGHGGGVGLGNPLPLSYDWGDTKGAELRIEDLSFTYTQPYSSTQIISYLLVIEKFGIEDITIDIDLTKTTTNNGSAW